MLPTETIYPDPGYTYLSILSDLSLPTKDRRAGSVKASGLIGVFLIIISKSICDRLPIMETVHLNVDMGQLDSSIPDSKRNRKDATRNFSITQIFNSQA
jgi:hypothetical protein